MIGKENNENRELARVIVPLVYLEKLGVAHQDSVYIDYSEDLDAIVITNKKTEFSKQHFDEAVQRSVDKYLKEKGM